jgi:hypothetical protein
MRDRLIELIKDAEKAFPKDKPVLDIEEFVADHLLANGVIVPPVPLGSRHKVYIPIKGTTVVRETKVYGIGIDEDGDMVINPKEYPEEVISIYGCNIGKTVFLTKELAEKALEEREGK